MNKVRQQTGETITLASNSEFKRIAAIEVYPAATLVSHHLPSRGYKKAKTIGVRNEILKGLKESGLSINAEAWQNALVSADVLDAILCVLAGTNFLKSEAYPPEHPALATKEGWIWVKKLESIEP